MEIGVLKLENFYDWMMFVYGILRIVANSCVSYYALRLFIKNLREPYVDIIKLLQTSFVFIWFFSDVITILISIFDNNLLNDPIVTVFVLITDPYMFCYGLNQFAWFILIQHLATYRMMADGKTYSECRKIIKSKEVKLFISMIIILTCLMLIQICLYTLKTTNTIIDQDLAKKFVDLEGIAVTITFTISEYILYIKVTKTLENCLNSFYIKNKKNLRYRMLLNISFFSVFTILLLVSAFIPSNANLMVTFNIKRPYDGPLNLLYIFGILLTDITSIIYACMNAKHIVKFRDWIIVVMEGHRILKHFNGCSIFIKKFKSFKNKENIVNFTEDEDETFDLESTFSDFEKDYIEDSEYQRNFKEKFVKSIKANE